MNETRSIHPDSPALDERLRILKETIPECFTEGKLDPDRLRELLSDANLEEGPERYGLFWPGKREARSRAFKPSKMALHRAPKEGVSEKKSKNLIIEGENLEVLKLLSKSYRGRVKMIYIDPPYNTGSDLLYDDKFAEDPLDYEKRTGLRAEDGTALQTNRKSSGRYHSNWLSMMYPRLILAQDLLANDGVIFVSIDDNEIHSLKHLMAEIFGEENALATFVWNSEGHTDNQYDIKVNHEYIVAFVRDTSSAEEAIGYVVDPNTREESNLWKGFAENSITKNGPRNPFSEIELPAGFPCKAKNIRLSKSDVPSSFFSEIKRLGYISKDVSRKYNPSYPIRLDDVIVDDGKLTRPCRVLSGWASADKLRQYINGECKPIVEPDGITTYFLSENGVIYYHKAREKARNILSVLRNLGTTEQMSSALREIGIPFSYPKPASLIMYLLKIACESNGIVLDFFAGSGTTAQAVLELNEEDGGNRQFILVQMQEATPEDSEARKAGFETIAEITKERVRRVIKKIETDKGKLSDMDRGFRVYKLAKTGFKEWRDYEGGNLEEYEKQLSLHLAETDDKAREEDLVAEIMLREGFPLDSTVERLEEGSLAVTRVESASSAHRLFVCLDEGFGRSLTVRTFEKLGIAQEDVFVCLDSALSDEAKLRIRELCRLATI